MPQGISPNPLNKISEVYLSQISEHHKKDADGNTIPHEGDLDEAKKPMVKVKLKDPSKIKVKVTDIGPGGKEYVRKNEMDEGAGLYANIHAKRKRGGKMRKKGEKGAPSSQDFANAARTAREEVEVDEAMAMKPSNMKKKAKLSAALDRLQALKVAKKKREMGEAFAETGMAKGSGKPSGVMKDFLDKRAKKLEKQRASQSQAARNNPAFDSTSPNSKDPAVARSRAEEVQLEAKYEAGASTYGKATIRNKRKFGTSGELPDPLTGKKITKDATRGELMSKRREEHKAKRGVKTKVKMEALSNWKEDYVWEADEEQMEKEVKEKKVKNKIIINPKLGEAVEELGGQLLDVQEMNGGEEKKEDPQMKSKMLRQRQLKKQVLLRKLQAVRQTGGEDIVASYEPEGEQLDEIGGLVDKARKFLKNMRNQKIPAGGGNFIKGGQMRDNEIEKFEKSLTNSYEPEGEQLDEYGNPRVGMRLRVARAIDKVNPKPKMGSKRTAISNKLKMSAIKAETKRREQKENPYSAGKKVRMALGMSNEDYIPEEGYDIARDMGKVPPTKDKKDATTMPRSYQPQKPAKGRSALDIVKADIRKKYGKDAIMDLGKK